MASYKHFSLKKEDAIALLAFDRKGEAVNTINDEVLDELNSILQDVSDMKVEGLIFLSAKEKGFIAGADVKTFTTMENEEAVSEFLRKGQAVFSRLEKLPIPTVCMIDGFCMGGGLELALACDYRIATDSEDTKLGLPEVLLGIHPGWGGTVRLPRLIGGFNAYSQVMLTGAPIRAKKAKKLGFVDDVVPMRQLKRAAIYYIKNQPKKHSPSFLQRLTNQAGIRSLLCRLVRSQISKRVKKQHYPAPYAMINLWENEGSQGDRAYLKEVQSIKKLVSEGNTARNLIRAFFLREQMKGFAKDSKFHASHVHVIGAGTMGGDIAAWCALKGLRVTLQDQSADRIAPAIARAYTLYEKKLKQPRLIQAAMDRIVPDVEGHGIQQADVIIEAVFENLKVKQDLFKDIEKKAKKDAILATNTSSIPLDDIASAMENGKRLVGIHFFNPVAKMELVEVVVSDQTLKSVAKSANSFVGQIGRLPLPVKSSPGFLINRVLMPYLMECVQLLEEGVAGETIDKAAKEFGMFMGPVELADTVGLDVCLAVAENLTQYFGGTVPAKLKEMVDDGRLGRKTGYGFYLYKKGKPVKQKVASDKKERQRIAERLIKRMVNEAAACLREGVVESADLLDGGMIFGTGFAPFRGGPINYVRTLGYDKTRDRFTSLESTYGDRFKADEGLKSLFNH
ncbi:3-hydroxyacyl-CoA dehydrogenase NAD-binding domain-containing protein [Legionella sp. W05-934-2]|jgi:3-hydroxyacyl-CoA dehydrogenase/enoyl-CoA hydratase/3-hydroxybutyryl-CoA epimerase|uniref:3-hydroxyacyl-CoA dehydrogenase NAD-binding domain-containing protein n=1 Tax=Legionella sp. W05-934-2 TaxID=1198649 RepID=UPI003462F3F7